jgi:hypothetical protein
MLCHPYKSKILNARCWGDPQEHAMRLKFKISNEELQLDITGQKPEFPKYTTQIINLANQNAQGTRPTVVGQMSDLIQEFPGKTYQEWKAWYQKQKPTAIKDATKKINSMLENLKKACDAIDSKMVTAWIEDLIFSKTFVGLRFQKSILKSVSIQKNVTYRLATPEEEAKGIDGFIGERPVSIKPLTYRTKQMLNEKIDVGIIYYDKKKDGIIVEFDF